MNEKINKNKLLIISISVAIVLVVALFAAYMYITNPKTVVLRSLNNVQKFLEKNLEQNITKGKITTEVNIKSDIDFLNFKLNNINLNTVSQIDGEYSDLAINIKNGDMNLPEILMVITNNNVYAKVSELSENTFLIWQLGQNRNLTKNTITDIVKILVNSLFELEVINTKEVVDIDGTKIKCTKNTIVFNDDNISSFLTSVQTKINKNKKLLEELNKYAKTWGYNDIISIIETYKKGKYGIIELSIYSKGLGELVKLEEKTINETTDTYSISFAGEKIVMQNNDNDTIIDYSNANNPEGNITISYTIEGENTNTINITSNSVIDKNAEIKKVDVTSAKDIKDLTSDEKNEIMLKLFLIMMKNSSLNGLDGNNTNIESSVDMGQTIESEEETIAKIKEIVETTKKEQEAKEEEKAPEKLDVKNLVELKYQTDMQTLGGPVLLYADAEEYSQICAVKYIKEMMRFIFEKDPETDLTKYKFILKVKKSDFEIYLCEAKLTSNGKVSTIYQLNDEKIEVKDELIVTGRVLSVSVEGIK